MRILHTSDWHLGARLGTVDRTGDQFARLEELCGHIDREEVDLLLVAGDVFEEHRSESLARIVRRLALLLKPRIEAGLTCVFIAGNHDREHVFPLLRGLQELVAGDADRRIIFAEKPALEVVTLRNDERLQLVLLPYPTPTRYDLSDQRWPTPDAKRRSLAEAVRARIGDLASEAKTNAGVPALLVGHFLVRGVKEGLYQLGEQEDIPIERSDLPNYAYVALGHIHKPQAVGANHIRYCGSLERMDRGEAADEKQAVLVEIGSELHTIREVPLDATPFAHITAANDAEVESAADALADIERTLVSLTLNLRRDQSLGPLQARARQLFPRLYGPPEIRWLDAPEAARPSFEFDRRDVPGTVRSYLGDRLRGDKDGAELLRLTEDLLAESEASVAP
jgi:exonuclease SbcD